MKSTIKSFSILFGLLSVLILFPKIAFGCSCYPSKPVDKKFAESSNVAILKLRSIKEAGPADNDPGTIQSARFVFSVEKVFKGTFRQDDSITLGVENMCSLMFGQDVVSTDFLFYLGEKPTNGVWVSSVCSGSGSTASITADLLFLENEAKMRGKTRLSGTVSQMVSEHDQVLGFHYENLEKRKIRIVGKNKNIELVSDKNGVFEIYDLLPGKYKVYSEPIIGYKINSESSKFIEVVVNLKSHTEANIIYSIDNSISGKIIDAIGKPIREVCVKLVPFGTDVPSWLFLRTYTDKSGTFEFGAIPEGSYVLEINTEVMYESALITEHFPGFYYPNTTNINEAAKIMVGNNFFLDNLTIVPPNQKETITLSGRLFYKDGKPAVKGMVQFLPGDQVFRTENEIVVTEFEILTDENGRFTLEILKSDVGVLRAVFRTYAGRFENCPEIENQFDSKGKMIQQLGSNDVIIDGSKDMSGIILTFPFSKCAESNDIQ